jgi:hypothetical protein
MSDAALGWVTLLVLTAVAIVVVTLAWRDSWIRESVEEAEARRRERQGSGGCGGV